MCGRVHCTLNAAQVARACGLQDGDADSVRTVEMDRFRPSYNVSPGTYLPVFTVRSDVQVSQVGNSCGVIHCMKWGLIPSFTKKSEKPDHYRMFNARSESVNEKASFRRLIPHNRCLVVVEGFYEWKKDGSKKQPYYIHFKDGRPLVFAALYDSWENLEGEILHTLTILTTRSSSALDWLHDRMPVIFGNKDIIDMWLSNLPLKLEAVLAPYADFDLVWYPVTSAMGKPSFEGPECIKEREHKKSRLLVFSTSGAFAFLALISMIILLSAEKTLLSCRSTCGLMARKISAIEFLQIGTMYQLSLDKEALSSTLEQEIHSSLVFYYCTHVWSTTEDDMLLRVHAKVMTTHCNATGKFIIGEGWKLIQ